MTSILGNLVAPSCRPAARTTARCQASRRGFTLAEVVLGSGLLAMFMLALPLAVRMARNAVPGGTSTSSATMNASRVADFMAADLAYATTVNSTAKYDNNHLTFTVPDRNGDGLPETIYYGCDNPPNGTIPKPPAGVKWLTRQYNGTSSILLNNVQEFQLAYDTISAAALPGTNQAGNTQVASVTTGASYSQVAVSSSTSYAQYVEPTLPANTVSWNLTKVRLQMLQNATGGIATVQIRSAVGGFPSSTILDEVTVSKFPNQINWQDVNFSNANGISPYSGICVVVLSASGNAACTLQYCTNSTKTGGYLSSSNGGSSWSMNTSNDLQIVVFGQPNVQGGGPTTNYYLNDVQLTLRTNSNKDSRVVATIRTYNQPQVPHQ